MNVINSQQQHLWKLSHQIRLISEDLGDKVWESSLQIESALLKLNEEIFGNKSYYENSPIGQDNLD